MSKISFYRQERWDGGIRTGIEMDGYVVMQSFAEGTDDSDPALLWYIDVRCEGAKLAAEPEKARKWFLEHAEIIRAGLRQLAGHIRAGVDADGWPLLWPMPESPRGVRITVAVSAVERLTAWAIAEKSRISPNIGKHASRNWDRSSRSNGNSAAMKKRLLDTEILISYWKKRRSTPLTNDTIAAARSWAQELIRIHGSNAIATPVFVEMLAGVMTSHELKLTRAFLAEFTCVDQGDIPEADWEQAIRLAQRVKKLRKRLPSPSRPRKLGDCLIKAIADRLHYEVQSRDKDYLS